MARRKANDLENQMSLMDMMASESPEYTEEGPEELLDPGEDTGDSDGQNIKFTVKGNSVASYYTSMANVVLMHKDENNTRTQNIYEKLAEGTTYG